MRCPKCGYNSFDHLAQCKKCGIDLTRTRQELGMLHVEPTNPFFLGTLLGDGDKTRPKDEKVFEEPLIFDDSEESSPSHKEEAIVPGFLQSQKEGKPLSAPSEATTQTPLPPAKAGPAEDDGFSIELSDELADWSFLDEQIDESFAARTEDIKETVDGPKQSDETKPKSKPRAEGDDDNVIELSEEDLEGLLLELDDTGKEKDKGDKS